MPSGFTMKVSFNLFLVQKIFKIEKIRKYQTSWYVKSRRINIWIIKFH